MKNILPVVLLLIGITACTQKEKDEKKVSKRPNIIFIMSDDHAYQAISAYGSNLIQTPNIDRLADEGMRFDHAYVTNSICAPSRAVILTGKFSHINGVTDNIDAFDSSQVTFTKLLQKNGYQTAIVGKWHLKSAPTGFDYWKVLPDQGNYYQPEFRTPEGIVKEQGYVTDVITNEAIKYLDTIRDKSKPFVLMYQHKAPHREWWPAMEDIKAFKDHKIPEPTTLFDDYEGRGSAAKEAEMLISTHMGLTNDNKIHPDIATRHGFVSFMNWYDRVHLSQYNRLTEKEKKKWDEVYGPINEDFDKNTPEGRELTRWKYQRYMQDYLGSIKSVDRNVGRLLDYLDSNGLAENTIVVYTSDQGFYLGEHGWFDKRFMYEESFRTPLIVRWPGKIAPNQSNKYLVQNLDFAPTFLTAAGVDVPDEMQGESMLPLFEGKDEQWRDALYYHYYEYPGFHMVKRHYGVKTNRYKLIHFYYDIDEWELYDLEKDPSEMQNVYNDPEYADVREQLHKKLDELRTKYKDSDELTKKMLQEDMDQMKK